MRKVLVSALAAAVLVVLFASAQGTAALWRAEGKVEPGVITTGSLSLKVGDGILAAQDFVFLALNTANLGPGGFVQAPLTISNTGTTPLDYTLAGATSSTTPQGAQDTALAAAVELSVLAAACPGGAANPATVLYKGPLASTATFAQARPLAMSGNGTTSETLCVRLALPASTPQAAAGGNLKLVLSWRGDQL